MKLADFLKEEITKKNFDPKKYIGETIKSINMIEDPEGLENVQIVLESGRHFLIQRNPKGLTITGR
jgi:hypothetical protein